MRLILSISFSLYLFAYAQNNYMYIEKSNGQIITYSISEIKELTFIGIPSTIHESKFIENVFSSFLLYQNYPNPFNPTTNIKYTIPNTGMVVINVYNINGSLVKTLVNNIQEAGEHITFWDATDNYGRKVSSGTYFCQILFENNSLVKKIIFIK